MLFIPSKDSILVVGFFGRIVLVNFSAFPFGVSVIHSWDLPIRTIKTLLLLPNGMVLVGSEEGNITYIVSLDEAEDFKVTKAE